MRKVRLLIHIHFKNSSLYETLSENHGFKLLLLFIATSFWLVFFVFGDSMLDFYRKISILGLEERFLSFSITMLMALTLVSGGIQVLSLFYFSKDIEKLLPLPLKPLEIAASKFLVILAAQYILYLVGIGILSVLYAFQHQPTFMFYICSCLLIVLTPLIPLCAISLICLVMMRFINVSKYKGAGRLVASLLIFMLPLLIRYLLRFNLSNEYVPWYELVGTWASKALSEYRHPIHLVPILGLALLSLILLLSATQLFYFKSVIGSEEGVSRAKFSSVFQFRANAVSVAYIKNQLQIYLLSPMLLVNCVLRNLWPTLLILLVLLGRYSPLSHIQFWLESLHTRDKANTLFLLFAIIQFQTGANYPAAISFSKDGSRIEHYKTMPIDFLDQVIYRVSACFLLLFIPCLIIISGLFIIIKLPFSIAFVAIILMVFSAFSGAMIGILTDMKEPKLNWDSEVQLTKSNFNMLPGTLYALFSLIALFWISQIWKTSFIIACLFCISISLILLIYFYIKIKQTGRHLLSKMAKE